ncbi:MAG: hypothetical protein ACO3R5_09030 [Pseudohongiellaceae bacterium]
MNQSVGLSSTSTVIIGLVVVIIMMAGFMLGEKAAACLRFFCPAENDTISGSAYSIRL